jgi:hypothetical protein
MSSMPVMTWDGDVDHLDGDVVGGALDAAWCPVVTGISQLSIVVDAVAPIRPSLVLGI